jgi:hypothetical protein
VCDHWYLLFEFAVDVRGEAEVLDFFELNVFRVNFHVQFRVVYHYFINPCSVFVCEQVILIFVVFAVEFSLV